MPGMPHVQTAGHKNTSYLGSWPCQPPGNALFLAVELFLDGPPSSMANFSGKMEAASHFINRITLNGND